MSRQYKITTKDRLGESATMNNGQKAEIIAYRRCDDIDLRFEDGTVVTSSYSTFKAGQIKNPNYQPHIGETAVNKEGCRMTLTAYRLRKDCTVTFDDGSVRDHVSYDSFLKGAIRHPDFEKDRTTRHLGETYGMHIGMKATIIAYRNRKDVDVRFENGRVGTHKQYISVVRGEVLYDGYAEDVVSEYIDKKFLHPRSGMMMEVIGGKGVTMLTVRFDDGYIKENVNLKSLETGKVAHPKFPLKQDQRLGEHKLNNQGFGMRITRYRNSSDIDVEYDDGTAVTGRTYRNFLIGNIRYPELNSYAGFSLDKGWEEEDKTHYYVCKCKQCGFEEILTPDQMLQHKNACNAACKP